MSLVKFEIGLWLLMLLAVFGGAIALIGAWLEERSRRIRYDKINRYRITPRIPFDWKDP